jgi:ubiquinone/menaquinone biosynthesis C-methylase UbiE
MGIVHAFVRQWQRPTGRLGRLLVWAMNFTHSVLTDWGLKHILIEKHFTILDIGCGGGGTVHKLAGIAVKGKVYGIDLSEDSVTVSRRTNKRFIKMGRVEIQNGSVSCLPFSDNRFDLVTAVNTYYYWPDLVSDMKELLRVLKPGGKLMILGEGYKGGKHQDRNRKFLEAMGVSTYHNIREFNELFLMAGYSDVQIFERYELDFICGIGTKPSSSSDR